MTRNYSCVWFTLHRRENNDMVSIEECMAIDKKQGINNKGLLAYIPRDARIGGQ